MNPRGTRMKTKTPLSLLSLFVALPVAAQVVSIGDLAGFKEALKDVPAPAAPASTAAPAAGLPRPACPVLSLDGATVGRGLFENDYTVKIDGREVGKVAADGDRLAYSAGGAAQAAAAIGMTGRSRTATVTGCDGEVIGQIVELDLANASYFDVTDASGRTIATSGAVDGTTWSLAGAGVSATIKNAHPIVDRYALSMSGIDGRLVLMAAIMNNAALYRRSRENRPPHEPHGGRGDR